MCYYRTQPLNSQQLISTSQKSQNPSLLHITPSEGKLKTLKINKFQLFFFYILRSRFWRLTNAAGGGKKMEKKRQGMTENNNRKRNCKTEISCRHEIMQLNQWPKVTSQYDKKSLHQDNFNISKLFETLPECQLCRNIPKSHWLVKSANNKLI